MASISKLQIRGIRSFSPNRDETIEFYSPLTMIVGSNGCGKTTIIECLKYACTGALPPSARSGQSFVNDPSMTDSTEVKANIKLRFLNKRGQAAVVIRSFSLTKKRTKVEFKALDGKVSMI
jgi:DNA repair protein RAD50